MERASNLQGTEDYMQDAKYLQALLDNMVDGVITINQKGIVQSWNRACQKIFGYEGHEVIGHNVSMLMPEPYRSNHDQYIENYIETGDAKIIGIGREVSGRKKNGENFPMDLSIGVVTNGGIRTFVGIIRDITGRKETEELLKRSNAMLDDFVYVVSHDLKEPLRGIYSFARFLIEDYSDKLDRDGQDKLLVLEKLAKRMEGLIDSLLAYSRIDRVHLAFQETNVADLLKDTIELLEPVITSKNVEIVLATDFPRITCDAAYVTEVFRNFIVNGLKYNDKEHKKIEIGCITYKDRNKCDFPLFYVSDNGIGIDPAHHDDVFQMFKRLHGKDEYGGGTGSGLTIVKKIIERHQGDVWVESDGKSGSTFYFTLQPCDIDKSDGAGRHEEGEGQRTT